MFLIQIAITAVVVHLVSVRQLGKLTRKLTELAIRHQCGDSTAAAELPPMSATVFTSLLTIASYWTAIVAGLAGVWLL